MVARETSRALNDLAAQQGGYFTAGQAVSTGYSHQQQRYHLLAGNWLRISRGLYRRRTVPPRDRDDLVILSLRSHNRAAEPQVVVSHDTALAIHELSDINPADIHLTVPPRFRKRMSERVVLHVARLQPSDWEEREGYRVTTPIRTLIDAAASPLPQEILGGAV